jgi:glucosamine--fructose-6-phosphate aminotransferase (isomerizing)
LERKIGGEQFRGNLGIGHTRWATHGKPSETNAHPHKAGGVVVVHNGIVENYLTLKGLLSSEGHTFKSETDTEILGHLIQRYLFKGVTFEEAVRQALLQVKGSYAIAVLYEGEKDKLIAARKESPLIVGVGNKEYFVASDIPAVLPYTRKMVFLEDGEMAVVQNKGFRITTLGGEDRQRAPKEILWDPVTAEKGGFKHFMLKEIFEQPRAIADTIRGRVSLDEGRISLEDLGLSAELLKEIRRVCIVACGTSYHAALVGKFMIEALTRIPTEVDLGSEFRYRDPIVGPHDLLVPISQSGETTSRLPGRKKKRDAGVIHL